MSVELLDKTRKMNRLLRDNRVSKVAFTDLCQLLGELLESSVYVISNKGKILGIHRRKDDISCSMVPTSEGEWLEPEMAKRFLEVLSTKENVNLEFMGFPKEETKEIQAMMNGILRLLELKPFLLMRNSLHPIFIAQVLF